MSQGGPCLGSPGVAPFMVVDALACRASMPTCGMFCGTLCGPHLPSDGLSGSSGGGALSLRLRMPLLRASYGGVPCTPVSFRGSSSGLLLLLDEPSWGGSGAASSPRLLMPISGASHGSWSSLHSMFFALGSNASGLVAVVSTAPLAGLILTVSSVGAGAAYVSNDTLPGLYISMTTHLMGSVPVLSAA
jgi:hypothetical protein